MSEPYSAPAVITFAKELQAWRKQAGLSKVELSKALGYTDSYIGQIELCKNLPSLEVAEAFDTYFKTNGLFVRLRERILETRHISLLPPGFAEYAKREGQASSIRSAWHALIDGILQTEDYARTVLGANQQPEIIEQLISERMKRKDIITRSGAVSAWFVLDECALHRVVGSRAIMKAQLEHIMEVSELPNAMVMVIPNEVGFHIGLTGSFYVLGFESGTNSAYTESAGIGILIEDPPRVSGYLERFSLLQGHALPHGAASRDRIKQVMEAL
jgi:transcriptional regulator with XRE-family HTH domain